MSRDAIHSTIVLCSLAAIAYGLWSIYAPLCPLVIGTLLLLSVIHARTQPLDAPRETGIEAEGRK